MANLLKSAAGLLGRGYDYLTPGAGSSRVTDWGGWGDTNRPATGSGGAGISPPPMPAPPTGAGGSASAEMARIQALLNSLSRPYTPPTPKIANFDIMGNWNKAKSAAEAAVNPLYDRKWNEFMAQQNANRAQANTQFGITNQNIQQEQTNSVEDNAQTRQRTIEDVAASLDKINQTEGNYQTDEGDSFDSQYRQMAQELSAGGNATTGLGAQAQADQIRLRNVTNSRQLQEFKEQRSAKELFRDRTVDDLAKGDKRAGELAGSKRQQAQFDLDSYMEDLANEEKITKTNQDIERQGEILKRTGENRSAQIESFLAGLPGQGYGAADIVATRQNIGG